VKRLQIYIDDDLYEALAVEASRAHTSKAALIRRFLGERLQPAQQVARCGKMTTTEAP